MSATSNQSSGAATPIPGAARDLFCLLLGLAVIYFVPTSLRPLTNPDEGRYVEIAREMVATGDGISPRLNGVLYFEKPPMFYWLESSAVAVSGTNLWVLRFWPITLALLGCAAIYGTGRALWGRNAGWWAGWALGTCLLYYAIGQIIILDMAVTVFITLALCAFMLAVRAPPGPRRRWWCSALYASMAVALLTKGLIGVFIPCAIVFLWLLLLNRWRELRHAHLLSGLVLIFCLAAPWHIAAALAHPPPQGWNLQHFFSKDRDNQGFLWYYFMHEQVWRYLDPSTSNRVQPWWFFLVILPAGFLPWMAFLPQAICASCKGGWAALKKDPETVLLFIWALFPLLFFSASSSKLVPYILPSVPPLALLAGRHIASALREPTAFSPLLWPLRALGYLSLILGLVLLLAPGLQFLSEIYNKLASNSSGFFIILHSHVSGPCFFVLAWSFIIGGAIIINLIRAQRLNLTKALAVMLGIVAILLFCANPIAAELLNAKRPSTAPVAAWLRPKLQPGDRVFTLWDYGPYQDFPALLGQTVGVAAHMPDEQEFGLQLEPDKFADRYPGVADWIRLSHDPKATPADIQTAQMNAFLDILRGPARVYVLVSAEQFPNFKSSHPTVPVTVAWSDDSFVLFTNKP